MKPLLFLLRFTLLLGIIIYSFFFLLMPLTAKAHNAPSGWKYDDSCCSGMDCAPIPDRGIRMLSNGDYMVPLLPGDHIFATNAITVQVLANKIKPSKDNEYHLCLSRNGVTAHCLYIPTTS